MIGFNTPIPYNNGSLKTHPPIFRLPIPPKDTP